MLTGSALVGVEVGFLGVHVAARNATFDIPLTTAKLHPVRVLTTHMIREDLCLLVLCRSAASRSLPCSSSRPWSGIDER
jgi:hypothetical protein